MRRCYICDTTDDSKSYIWDTKGQGYICHDCEFSINEALNDFVEDDLERLEVLEDGPLEEGPQDPRDEHELHDASSVVRLPAVHPDQAR